MSPQLLHSASLSIVRARGLEAVLDGLVQALADQPEIGLARVWLIGKGDRCPDCAHRSQCRSLARCLHLAAAAGLDAEEVEAAERVPITPDSPVGHIAMCGQPALLESGGVAGLASWIGHPLRDGDEPVGVLGVDTRRPATAADCADLRPLAEQAGAVIAHARTDDRLLLEGHRLERESAYLRAEIREATGGRRIVGESAAIQKVNQQVHLVAATEAPVLISGESGTGKELVARSLHEGSGRSSRSLVKVHCSTMSPEECERELFAPGARCFELAEGSTLYLDEIAMLPLGLQAKLLHLLQEGELTRSSGAPAHRVDVRLLSATTRDLRKEVDAGRFRLDLYYRLSVFPIEVPPLRERQGDIALLTAYFAERAARRLGRPVPTLPLRHVRTLEAYDWPGNVRELQAVIERAVLLTPAGSELKLDLGLTPATPPAAAPAGGEPLTREAWKHRERENLIAAMERCRWKIYGRDGAAAVLGTRPTTLASRLKALGIEKPR